MCLTDTVVVGVKQNFILRVERLVACSLGFQQKGLKEPGDVGEVPFRRTGVVHGLHLIVLDFKWTAQLQGLLTDSFVPGPECRFFWLVRR